LAKKQQIYTETFISIYCLCGYNNNNLPDVIMLGRPL